MKNPDDCRLIIKCIDKTETELLLRVLQSRGALGALWQLFRGPSLARSLSPTRCIPPM